MSQVIDDSKPVDLHLNRGEATILLQLIRIRQDEHKHIVASTTERNPNHNLYKQLDTALEMLKMKIAGQI